MENYSKIKKIGEGSFGRALLVKRKSDKKQCVIKEIGISKMNSKERAESKKEVQVLSQLKHPNIVSYLESFEGSGNLYIVMDYCDGGDLYQLIVNQRGLNLSESKVLDIFVQCCLAVKYIHDRKILHRDIKTQNIFLTRNHIVKLGDFGIARVLKNTMELARTCIGTPYYLSPEIVENRPYNNKSDIWSLGCVLYELSTLKHAFEAGNMKALVMKIVRGSYPPLPNKYSHELRALVAHCFKRAPSERPSITTLLRKPIVQQRISKYLSPEKLEEEFNNIAGAKQKVSNPNSRPSSVVSNKPSKRPISAAKKAMDPALIYGVSISKKPSPARRPISAIHKDQKLVNKGPSNYKKLQDAREKRRKELLAQEKHYQDHVKNLQEQRWQKQQQVMMNKAREDGWKKVLSSKEEVTPSSVNKLNEEKNSKLPDDEKPNKHFENIPPVSAQQEEKDVNQMKRDHQPSNDEGRGRLLEEFWQRKNAAAAYKERRQQEMNHIPVEHDNPLLQFHRHEMARQGQNVGDVPLQGGARNKQEMEYLKQLEAIRKQNYLERKAVKAYAQQQPGQLYKPSQPVKENADPRFDPVARKAKIAALKEQAEQRAEMLREQLELRRRQAVVRLERERIDRMRKFQEEQDERSRAKPQDIEKKPPVQEKIFVPAVGMETAFNQVSAPKLFRSCSEGDLQNMVKGIANKPARKGWKKGVPQAPFEFVNMPMEITSSAMEATVFEESEKPVVGEGGKNASERSEQPIAQWENNAIQRKHWEAEGKTQLVSMLHNIALSGTKLPTLQAETIINPVYVQNNKNNIGATITLNKASPTENNIKSDVSKSPTSAGAASQTIVLSSRNIKSEEGRDDKQSSGNVTSEKDYIPSSGVVSAGRDDIPSAGNVSSATDDKQSSSDVSSKKDDKKSSTDVSSEKQDEQMIEEIFLNKKETKNTADNDTPPSVSSNSSVNVNEVASVTSSVTASEIAGNSSTKEIASNSSVNEIASSVPNENPSVHPGVRSAWDDSPSKESESRSSNKVNDEVDEEVDESLDSFHTPDSRNIGLRTGCYDTQKKMLRTCSLPDLRDKESSPISLNEENELSEDCDMEDDEEDDDVSDDVSDVEIMEDDSADYESMLESMRGLLNSTDEAPNETLQPNKEDEASCKQTLVNNFVDDAEEEWGSAEEDDNDDNKLDGDEKHKRVDHLKDTLFSRIEESRKKLEDELGFDVFMKVYRHVQMIQENDDEDAELSSDEISELLGEKDYLYQKILYLVMADSAYCEGNDGD